jgi:uncharacterized protein
MGKIVLWIVIIFAILFVLRMLSVAKARRDRQSANANARDSKTPGPMVRCADCGVYLPRADALPSPKGFGCGDPNCAHRGSASR